MLPSERSAQIGALYQEMILDHYRRPRNKGEIENPDETIVMKNPLCGDEITVQVRYEDDTVADVGFIGRGCSISQASASMMTQLIKGKKRDEIEGLRSRFREMVMGDETAQEDKSLGSLRALGGVAKFPARVKCALLAWNALEEGMKRKG
ncbi:MAG TPA: SUF system NifU family Fe-S cluster assembly protein [Gemmatimonadaceae bacterium]|nr:SUF system NifU family Fe-S cluster assembly protein [Gemmatimonadaceae bacterium]